MKITGKLVQKFETKMFGAKKDFAVREFVINDVITLQDGREFDNPLKMQLVKDNTKKLDAFNVGDTLDVEINIKGKQYTAKDGSIGYFVTLEAWKIDALQGHPADAQLDANDTSLPF